jgi:hypothetical protein
MAEVLFEFDGS